MVEIDEALYNKIIHEIAEFFVYGNLYKGAEYVVERLLDGDF